MSLDRCPCCDTSTGLAPTDEARCDVCGHLWREAPGIAHYTNQQNRNHLAASIGERKIGDRLNSLRPLLRENMRILEIGCAEGLLGARVKQLLPLEYWGLEISTDANAAAKHLDRVLRIPAAECDAVRFDLIVSYHVLEHIARIGDELSHWKRLLKPCGRLVLEVPNGAGHDLLARDPNPEHAHQFSPASLALVMHRAGFRLLSLSSGHFESPTYSDSLRLLAEPAMAEADRTECLRQRFLSKLGPLFVVYGLGGDFRKCVAPLLDRLPVAALCDGNQDAFGTIPGQHKVVAYDATRFVGLPVLIASQRHEDEIRAFLSSQGVPDQAMVGLADIYDSR
jgi:SAM-dependent methyltransferase